MKLRYLLPLLLILSQVSLAQEIELQLERAFEPDLYFPTDICGNDKGDVFVLDAMNDRIVEINSRGQVKTITPDRGTIYKAVGIACIDGELWIADTPRSRLLQLGRNGRINRVIPLVEGTEPVDLVGMNDQIIVSNRANHNMIVLDVDGKVKSTWGRRGDDLGEFINPGLLAAGPENRLLITDILNRRVVSYSPSGRYPQMVAKPGIERGQVVRPKGVAFNAANQVWVTDGYTGSLQLFTLSGRFQGLAVSSGNTLQLDAPVGLWVDKDGKIWVVESTTNKVSVYRVKND